VRRGRRLGLAGAAAALLVSAGVYVPVTLTADPPAAVAQVDAPDPVVAVVTPESWPGPGVSAVGAVGFDGVLATNDVDPVPRPMASITKIVTALVVLEARPLAAGEEGPQVTFTAEDEALRLRILQQDGIVEPAVVGTSLSQRDLVEGALLASANNYAAALGVWAYGSDDAFVAAANAWLADHGLTGTHVADAMGLSPETVSTTADLVRIGEMALADPVLADVVDDRSADVAGVGTVENRNLLASVPGFRGIKTGTLEQAGKCLLWAVDTRVGDRDVTVVGVTLGAVDHPELARQVLALLPTVTANMHVVPVARAGQPFADLDTAWGATAQAVSTEDASVLVWGDTQVVSAVAVEPVGVAEEGTPVGTVTVTAGEQTVRVPLALDRAIPTDSGAASPAPESVRRVRPGPRRRVRPLGRAPVAGGLVAEAPQHPRDEVGPSPADVARAGLGPGARGERLGLQGLQVVLDRERLQHHARDRVVAERREVQPVDVPHARVLDLGQRPLVGHDAVVPGGDGADVLVVDGDLAAEPAEDGGELDVGAREEHHRGALGGQARDHAVEALGEPVGVGAGTEDVVAARGEGHEVGVQGQGGLDLLVRDLGEEPPADREVRVGEALHLVRQHLGHAVGPAAVAGGAARLGVADALREGVAEGDVAAPGVGLGHARPSGGTSPS
jgi:D-alanyl-D-alanine carboxypeptidase (penicillin-binding protein 5/6)